MASTGWSWMMELSLRQTGATVSSSCKAGSAGQTASDIITFDVLKIK